MTERNFQPKNKPVSQQNPFITYLMNILILIVSIWLDQGLGTAPFFTIIGVGIMFINLYKVIKSNNTWKWVLFLIIIKFISLLASQN